MIRLSHAGVARVAAKPSLVPGLALALVLSVVAFELGTFLPLVGGPIFGLILGYLVHQLPVVGSATQTAKAGMAWAGKRLLRYAIVLLGADMSLAQVWQVGSSSLAVMLSSLIASLLAAWLVGRALSVNGNLATLLGVGTGICGASAIAAAAPVIGAAEQEIAYALATVFAFNMAAVVVFPVIGHALGFGQHAFGLWAGTAINDTSSVVAAGFAYGQEAGQFATVVKLTRATMIVPITVLLALYAAWKGRGIGRSVNWRTTVPWFIGGFLLVAAARTWGLIPSQAAPVLAEAGRFFLITALVGVGYGADFGQLRQTGWAPLALGLIVWAVVACTSLAVQAFTA